MLHLFWNIMTFLLSKLTSVSGHVAVKWKCCLNCRDTLTATSLSLTVVMAWKGYDRMLCQSCLLKQVMAPWRALLPPVLVARVSRPKKLNFNATDIRFLTVCRRHNFCHIRTTGNQPVVDPGGCGLPGQTCLCVVAVCVLITDFLHFCVTY